MVLIALGSCSDSILINGRGSIYCKDPEELTALQTAQIKAVVTEPLTDKGYLDIFVSQGNV
jgi:hypothetical protein